MIQLQLNHEALYSMYFDDIKGGKATFRNQGDAMVGTISQEEFDGFLKANNLITYHNTLKGYEDGTVYGEFEVNS